MNPDRYTVISADGHAGASVPTYREYLASRWYDEFDAWAQSFQNPFADLAGIERVPQLGLRRNGSPSSKPTASSPRCCSPTRSRRSSRRARS